MIVGSAQQPAAQQAYVTSLRQALCGVYFLGEQRQQQQVSLIFIDLDGFKAINDRFGHPCGDSFLVQVGKRLNAITQWEDIVGRLGGDEFLIVGSAQQPAAQQAYVTSLRQALCGVYFLGDLRIDYEGASFGVVTCDPQSIDVEAALPVADEAMYQDKKSRRRRSETHPDRGAAISSIMQGIIRGHRDTIMKLGILFPVAIFIIAVVFLGWFFVGGYAAPGGA
ncbi:YoaK family small membrane protein [Klebsiella pneumoniae]